MAFRDMLNNCLSFLPIFPGFFFISLSISFPPLPLTLYFTFCFPFPPLLPPSPFLLSFPLSAPPLTSLFLWHFLVLLEFFRFSWRATFSPGNLTSFFFRSRHPFSLHFIPYLISSFTFVQEAHLLSSLPREQEPGKASPSFHIFPSPNMAYIKSRD